MKAVLISIQPKWVEMIVSGEKTIEVRKSRPKIETPFKCYIYCTNGDELIDIREEKYLQIEKPFVLGHGKSNNVILSSPPIVNRKVIGEFICDEIIVDEKGENQDIICENACLTRQELYEYEPRKTIYGLHISNLKIYDKPKGVNEFRRPCNADINNCRSCINSKLVKADVGIAYLCCRADYLTRPPQSWCYVEA